MKPIILNDWLHWLKWGLKLEQCCRMQSHGMQPSTPLCFQTPSLLIQILPSNSARFGYAAKGELPGPPRIFPPKQRHSLPLAIFLDPSFSPAGVRNGLFEFCVQRCFKFSTKWWLEISRFSHEGPASWRSVVAFGKQMLGEPSRCVNIGCVRSEYETVPTTIPAI